MSPTDVVTAYRPTLLAIAYRMTGEVMVSEDLVQDVLLNFVSRSPEGVIDPKAYLVKSLTHTTLNYLARVKRRRQAYKGVWLPEPVLATNHILDAKLDISYGLMLVLEKLAPLERAIFVLKESFDFTYSELAPLFGTTETNSRQLYRRANKKMAAANRRFVVEPAHQQALLEAFAKAGETGNTEALIQLLKRDVVSYSDGGGKAIAALKPIVGVVRVALFLRTLANKFGHQWQIKPVVVNGQVALFFRDMASQLLHTVLVIEADPLGISGLYFVRNPDKLAHLP